MTKQAKACSSIRLSSWPSAIFGVGTVCVERDRRVASALGYAFLRSRLLATRFAFKCDRFYLT